MPRPQPPQRPDSIPPAATCDGGDKAGEDLVVLARVGKPHGIKGWMRLNSYTSPPENVLHYRRFRIAGRPASEALEIDDHSKTASPLLVHFSGYDNPEDARQLIGLELAVQVSELPSLPTGEFYWHQLQGLSVVNQAGIHFGKVQKLLETGANDVLVVAPDAASVDQKERLIPYLPDAVVLNVDLASQRITVDWEPDYLD